MGVDDDDDDDEWGFGVGSWETMEEGGSSATACSEVLVRCGEA